MRIEEEKKYFASWWLWCLLLIVIAFIIFGGLRITGIIGERVVFEQSYQYKEARKSEIVVFESQLTQIDIQLSNPDLDNTTRSDLEAQKAAITIQLNAARSK